MSNFNDLKLITQLNNSGLFQIKNASRGFILQKCIDKVSRVRETKINIWPSYPKKKKTLFGQVVL